MITMTPPLTQSWSRDLSFVRVSTADLHPDRVSNRASEPMVAYSPALLMRAVLERWVEAAARLAKTSVVDGYFVAEVPGIPEAWIEGSSAQEALDALPAVLHDWAELALDAGSFPPECPRVL